MTTKEEWAFSTSIKACNKLLSCVFKDSPRKQDVAMVWGVKLNFVGVKKIVRGMINPSYTKAIRFRKRSVPRIIKIKANVANKLLTEEDIKEFLVVLSKTVYLLAGTPLVVAKRMIVKKNYFMDKAVDRGSRVTSILQTVKLLLGELYNPRPEYYIK